jgi:hypothetical protein
MKSSLHRLTLKSSTELVDISSLSPSTPVSRDSLNYHSSGLGSSLHSLGAAPTENTISIVIAHKYFDCCLFILSHGSLFTESLPSNERLVWLRYSGFQASCHNMLHSGGCMATVNYIREWQDCWLSDCSAIINFN